MVVLFELVRYGVSFVNLARYLQIVLLEKLMSHGVMDKKIGDIFIYYRRYGVIQ